MYFCDSIFLYSKHTLHTSLVITEVIVKVNSTQTQRHTNRNVYIYQHIDTDIETHRDTHTYIHTQ